MTDRSVNISMSPRSQKQLENIRSRSRENIKLAALKLFAHNGYHNTSVEKIAKKAGVSKGLAYNYFKGKEKILEAVIFETFHEMAQGYGFLAEKGSPRKKLLKIIDTYFDWVFRDPEFWRLYCSVLFNPGLPQKIEKDMNKAAEPLFDQLTRIFRELGIKNPAAECIVFHATLDGLSVHCKLHGDKKYLKEVKQLLKQRYMK